MGFRNPACSQPVSRRTVDCSPHKSARSWAAEHDRNDHQGVAFVAADRLAVPGRLRIGGVRHVEIDAPDLLVVRIYHYNFFRGLDEVKRLETVEMKSGNTGRHAERMRRKGVLAS